MSEAIRNIFKKHTPDDGHTYKLSLNRNDDRNIYIQLQDRRVSYLGVITGRYFEISIYGTYYDSTTVSNTDTYNFDKFFKIVEIYNFDKIIKLDIDKYNWCYFCDNIPIPNYVTVCKICEQPMKNLLAEFYPMELVDIIFMY